MASASTIGHCSGPTPNNYDYRANGRKLQELRLRYGAAVPHLSKHIVDLLRTASETRQVLATTHNPNFLDELKPEEVILCDKTEGFTVVRHAFEVAEIKSFRKHFRLGELWEQGTLGGIP